MKIAILHPWFLAVGGAEQTVGAMVQAFPDADCFSILLDRKHLPESLTNIPIQPSRMNWLPAKYEVYRYLLALWPSVVESLDLRGYDVVISCDSSVMKGVLVDQGAVHLCYCHSPMRCLWDLHSEYYSSMPLLFKPFFGLSAHYVRSWDFLAAQRVDYFVANSKYISQRIGTYYRRSSTVIYPPVEVENGYLADHCSGDYYLSMGRLTATKRIDILIDACNKLKRRLIVAGLGREEKSLRAISGPTIEFVGQVPQDQLPHLYANCRALMFAADEDFGIVPVEAQAYGRPVIAFGRGGSLETVRVGDPLGKPDTGVFFYHQDVDSLIDGIRQFETCEHLFAPTAIRAYARQFDRSVFIEKMRDFVASVTLEHANKPRRLRINQS